MRKKLAIVLNLVLALAGCAGIAAMMRHAPGIFYYYTIDSNLLAILASLAYLLGEAAAARDLWGTRARWPGVFRYMAVCCLMVTFLVVVLILFPIFYSAGTDAAGLFTDWNLFFHVLAPVLSTACFCFLEDHEELSPLHAFTALIPTLIYAVVIIAMNILGKVDGPYPFLRVCSQPVWVSVLWIAAIGVLNVLIALAVGSLARKCSRRARIRANRKRAPIGD